MSGCHDNPKGSALDVFSRFILMSLEIYLNVVLILAEFSGLAPRPQHTAMGVRIPQRMVREDCPIKKRISLMMIDESVGVVARAV